MKALGLTTGLEGKRVVVQGLGNVGYHAAKFCREGGALIVAIAEYEGAIANPEGPRPEDAVVPASQATAARSSSFPGATPLASTAAALELDCDILIPAALENVLTAENAPRDQGEDHPRRRQRPDDARRRADLPAEGACWSFPTSTPTPAASPCRTSSG